MKQTVKTIKLCLRLSEKNQKETITLNHLQNIKTI